MHEHAPNLLNDDGSASMATTLMMSHHGLRRDLALFARALAQAASWQAGTAEHLKQEWTSYRNVLHGHHEAEDTQLFPNLRGQHPELVAVIDQLTADHRHIDPLMEQGDRAFAQLPDTKPAAALVSQLWHLLGPHLRTEEERIVPQLRGAREFPPPASPDELELFAQGFAWSSHGVAPGGAGEGLRHACRGSSPRACPTPGRRSSSGTTGSGAAGSPPAPRTPPCPTGWGARAWACSRVEHSAALPRGAHRGRLGTLGSVLYRHVRI